MYTNKLVFCLYKLIFKLVLGKETGFAISLFFKTIELVKRKYIYPNYPLCSKAMSYPDVAFIFLETYYGSSY